MISLPACTVPGLAVFVMDRSASAPTGTTTVDVLLRGFGSYVAELIVPVLLTESPAKSRSSLTVSVMVAVAPEAMSPSEHVSVAVAGGADSMQVPAVVFADTKVVPAGRVSDTVAPAAVDGPLFAASKVYTRSAPGAAVGDDADLVIERSAVLSTGVSTSLVS